MPSAPSSNASSTVYDNGSWALHITGTLWRLALACTNVHFWMPVITHFTSDIPEFCTRIISVSFTRSRVPDEEVGRCERHTNQRNYGTFDAGTSARNVFRGASSLLRRELDGDSASLPIGVEGCDRCQEQLEVEIPTSSEGNISSPPKTHLYGTTVHASSGLCTTESPTEDRHLLVSGAPSSDECNVTNAFRQVDVDTCASDVPTYPDAMHCSSRRLVLGPSAAQRMPVSQLAGPSPPLSLSTSLSLSSTSTELPTPDLEISMASSIDTDRYALRSPSDDRSLQLNEEISRKFVDYETAEQSVQETVQCEIDSSLEPETIDLADNAAETFVQVRIADSSESEEEVEDQFVEYAASSDGAYSQEVFSPIAFSECPGVEAEMKTVYEKWDDAQDGYSYTLFPSGRLHSYSFSNEAGGVLKEEHVHKWWRVRILTEERDSELLQWSVQRSTGGADLEWDNAEDNLDWDPDKETTLTFPQLQASTLEQFVYIEADELRPQIILTLHLSSFESEEEQEQAVLDHIYVIDQAYGRNDATKLRPPQRFYDAEADLVREGVNDQEGGRFGSAAMVVHTNYVEGHDAPALTFGSIQPIDVGLSSTPGLSPYPIPPGYKHADHDGTVYEFMYLDSITSWPWWKGTPPESGTSFLQFTYIDFYGYPQVARADQYQRVRRMLGLCPVDEELGLIPEESEEDSQPYQEEEDEDAVEDDPGGLLDETVRIQMLSCLPGRFEVT